MRARCLLGTLLLVALVAGCGDDDGGEQASTGTTPTTATTESTETTATTLETTTTSVAVEPACPEVPAPAGAAPSAEADLDGDGSADAVTTVTAEAGRWLLHAALSRGGGTRVEVDSVGPTVQPLGGFDLDGDGAEELWVQTGSGASTAIVGLFALDGCELVRVDVDTVPAEFPVGGSVRHVGGVECRDGQVLVHTGSSDDGVTFTTTTDTYRLEGTSLVRGPSQTGTARADDPAFERAATFTCGDVQL